MKNNLETALENIFVNFMTVIVSLFMSAILLSFLVMWLWNSTLPLIFGLKSIGYWEAFRLYYLSGLLIKSVNVIKEKSKD